MASYYRRKNGTYCIRVSNGKPGGKQELVSTTYKPPQGLSASAAEKGAKEFAELFEAAVHNGMFTPGRKQRVEQINPFGVTLSDFIEQHYYKRIEMRLSPNTDRFYTYVIEQCILPSFGKLRLCDISSAHLQALIDYLATSGSRADESQSEPLSASTVKRYATVFSSVMTEAFKMGLMEKDVLPEQRARLTDEEVIARCPWAANGKTAGRKPNIITSLELDPSEMEKRNIHLQAKYAEIEANEVRFEEINCEDAEYLIVAFGSCARIAQKTMELARAEGIKVGLLRPITLWPFPSKAIAERAKQVKGILTVELNAGQMVEDVRLAVECKVPVEHFGRLGGIVPDPDEVVNALKTKLIK